MPARDSTSKKASDANSTSSPQPDITFYLDKCLGRNVIAAALRSQGYAVELHTDHFPEDEDDHIWLPQVGEKGWIILTKDNHIHRNQIEIAALLKSNTATFALRAKSATGQDMAMAFVKALPSIQRFLDKFEIPFIATVTMTGHISILCTLADLMKRID
jgi:predicted nuclease of predicted toxin-antitoxin system